MTNDKKINWDLWNFSKIEQIHTSKATSINFNQMPSTIKLIEHLFISGQKWADIGGGRFDNVKAHLALRGVELYIYDPFNRSQEENLMSVQAISRSQCDGVMVNNVLNVIEEKSNRLQAISQAHDTLKDNSFAFFKIYQGDKSGVAKIITKGENTSYQLNQRTKFYVDEIKSVFGDKVSVSNELIIVQKTLTNDLTLHQKDNIDKNENNLHKSSVLTHELAHRFMDTITQKIKKPSNSTHLMALIGKAKKIGVPQRSGKEGVGKLMGKNLYIHAQYEDILPEAYQTAKNILKTHAPDFSFNIIKYNREDNSVSFIHSPDFDTSSEPIVGNIIRVSGSGEIKQFKQKSDPQIYHHKWNFVRDDYAGFDVKESIERSISWKSEIGQNKDISSRIGTKSFWTKLGK